MSSSFYFLPALLQILLTVILYIALARAKTRAAQAGQVNEQRRSLHDDAWPDSVLKINNNIRNQFELPVLFYALTIICWQLGITGPLIQGLGWVFVVSRYLHAFIHTGVNDVMLRRRVFMVGPLVIVIMVVIALGVLFRLP